MTNKTSKEDLKKREKFWELVNLHRPRDEKTFTEVMTEHMEYTMAKHEKISEERDFYTSTALSVRDYLVEEAYDVNYLSYAHNVKRVYYLSMEYLMGRALCNNLINMGLYSMVRETLDQFGLDLDTLTEYEADAGLGNGGLGRLAACFLDSMSTLGIPCFGYGLRYDYGIFAQKIVNGFQVEEPDEWLKYGNQWEIKRQNHFHEVGLSGTVHEYMEGDGRLYYEWTDRKTVRAVPHDMLIPGYGNNVTNFLRLWTAKAIHEFDLNAFNDGFYLKAVEQQGTAETISKVLYPNDNSERGKMLRLMQEYFFVSATMQDIISRHLATNPSLDNLHEKAAIQLNDTHPALAIPELMRLMLDRYRYTWEDAWEITVKTFSYTNHTVMPEAMEKWSVRMMESLLPRHLQIIYEINRRFLAEIAEKYPGDNDKLRRVSLIEEGGEKSVRMAHVAVVGSHKVNGVAALHSKILAESLFRDFAEYWPDKFTNKTNGITQRRWLLESNRPLSSLITETIGDKWVVELDELKKLAKLANDAKFQQKWDKVKLENKKRLAEYIENTLDVKINVHSIFDCQVKRIHEYKRQLLNVLHIITLYNRIKANPGRDFTPRTVIISGKAAAGYYMAKLIIKLINSVASVVNSDPDVGDRLKVVFLPNYSVSLAELIIPAADLSQQISTAGMEASGTGNMKLSLNGALTIGTLDGANIEIKEEVGDENIFIFGLTSEEVDELNAAGYNPMLEAQNNAGLKKCLDMISSGYFSNGDREMFKDIVSSLIYGGDKYYVTKDYNSYIAAQAKVDEAYRDKKEWVRMSILNSAHMGKFSSDRTIREYNEEIWKVDSIIPRLEERKKDRKNGDNGKK